MYRLYRRNKFNVYRPSPAHAPTCFYANFFKYHNFNTKYHFRRRSGHSDWSRCLTYNPYQNLCNNFFVINTYTVEYTTNNLVTFRRVVTRCSKKIFMPPVRYQGLYLTACIVKAELGLAGREPN